MTCETPQFTLPRTFEDWEDNKQVTKQEEMASNFTVTIESESLDFFLGFYLDGVKKYKNLNETTDMTEYSQITVHATLPSLHDSNSIITFVPFTNQRIAFKVRP